MASSQTLEEYEEDEEGESEILIKYVRDNFMNKKLRPEEVVWVDLNHDFTNNIAEAWRENPSLSQQIGLPDSGFKNALETLNTSFWINGIISEDSKAIRAWSNTLNYNKITTDMKELFLMQVFKWLRVPMPYELVQKMISLANSSPPAPGHPDMKCRFRYTPKDGKMSLATARELTDLKVEVPRGVVGQQTVPIDLYDMEKLINCNDDEKVRELLEDDQIKQIKILVKIRDKVLKAFKNYKNFLFSAPHLTQYWARDSSDPDETFFLTTNQPPENPTPMPYPFAEQAVVPTTSRNFDSSRSALRSAQRSRITRPAGGAPLEEKKSKKKRTKKKKGSKRKRTRKKKRTKKKKRSKSTRKKKRTKRK